MSRVDSQLVGLDRKTLQGTDLDVLGELARPLLVAAYGRWDWAGGSAHAPEAWYRLLVAALQPEARSLEDLVALAAFAYGPGVSTWASEARAALAEPCASAVLVRCHDTVTDEALASPASAKDFFRDLRHALRDEAGLRGRQVMFPLRAALTGTMRGPCLGLVATLLGAARCRRRIEDGWTCG